MRQADDQKRPWTGPGKVPIDVFPESHSHTGHSPGDGTWIKNLAQFFG